jgi:hypothetical protein
MDLSNEKKIVLMQKLVVTSADVLKKLFPAMNKPFNNEKYLKLQSNIEKAMN